MSAAAFLGAVRDRVPPESLAQLGTTIDEAEALLKFEMGSLISTVADCGNQTLLAGGKRLRPALTIACAGATGAVDAPGVTGVAAAMEMIHMATLIHDDVIDRAAIRRGVPTAGALFGNTEAVLSGDVLLAKAMRLLAENSNIEMLRMVSQGVVDLAEGEVYELECRGKLDLSQEDHLRVLDLKTAAFIACCCRAGARLNNAPINIEGAVGDYGRHLGLAFQLVDDCLDYRGIQAKTGKPRATDFRDGQATWPLIALLPLVGDFERERISTSFGTACDDGEIVWLVAKMEEQGTLQETLQKAKTHIDTAILALAPIDDNPFTAVLETVARFIVEREA